MNDITNIKPVLTPEEFIKTFGFGRSMTYENLLKRDDFPCFRIGKRIFIVSDRLPEWFAKQCDNK